MKRGPTGGWVRMDTQPEPYSAFVPSPLPPEPQLHLDLGLQDQLERANRSLGRLDGVSMLLPDTSLFLYFYVRKEAVLSSQIEGTQSSLSDLLLYEQHEAPGVPIEDVTEVSNYVAALEHGLARLRGGFPLSLRLFREMHEFLLRRGRGAERDPGEFRRSQNWIGGSRPGNASYVPPPPDQVLPTMGALEKFLHDDPIRTPTLIKAALAHVQFETIHPFLDGNGRLGRMLVTFLLCSEGVLSEPLLYLSLFFKANRVAYYDLLQAVRLEGDWEAWLSFFLEGVDTTSQSAAKAAQRTLRLFAEDLGKIEGIGRGSGSAMRLHDRLKRHPLQSIRSLSKDLGLSRPSVTHALEALASLGIVVEVSGKRRDRLFAYDAYLRLLSEGTDPIPPRRTAQ